MVEGKLILIKGKNWFFLDSNSKKFDLTKEIKEHLEKNVHRDKPCKAEIKGNQLIYIIVEDKRIPSEETIEAKKKDRDKNEKLKAGKDFHEERAARKEYNLSEEEVWMPKDTRMALFHENGNNKHWSIDNFSLKLNKTANFRYEKNKTKAIIYEKGLDYSTDFSWYVQSRVVDKQKKMAELLFNKDNYSVISCGTESSLIVGLGNESVYEVCITLHHIYGVPLIPATTVKGVTRSWAINFLFDSDEIAAQKDKDFCDIFGYAKDEGNDHLTEKGNIIFLDAFPVNIPKIVPDVMNVHYSEYYSSNSKEPSDDQNPNPIFFLTVARDTIFQFIIGLRKNNFLEEERRAHILSKAKNFLTSALQEQGVGAKTAIGYGFFNPPTP